MRVTVAGKQASAQQAGAETEAETENRNRNKPRCGRRYSGRQGKPKQNREGGASPDTVIRGFTRYTRPLFSASSNKEWGKKSGERKVASLSTARTRWIVSKSVKVWGTGWNFHRKRRKEQRKKEGKRKEVVELAPDGNAQGTVQYVPAQRCRGCWERLAGRIVSPSSRVMLPAARHFYLKLALARQRFLLIWRSSRNGASRTVMLLLVQHRAYSTVFPSGWFRRYTATRYSSIPAWFQKKNRPTTRK